MCNAALRWRDPGACPNLTLGLTRPSLGSRLATTRQLLSSPLQSLELLATWAEKSSAGWGARAQWTAAVAAPKPGSDGSFPAPAPMEAAEPAVPAYLAPPPLAFHLAKFERQSGLMHTQIEEFLSGGAEPLMPGWVDLPDGIGLIDGLDERIENGIHYTGPPIDIDM